MSEKGSANTNTAAPATVAAKQAGRATTVSTAIASGLPSLIAEAGVALQRPMAAARRQALNRAFMIKNYRSARSRCRLEFLWVGKKTFVILAPTGQRVGNLPELPNPSG